MKYIIEFGHRNGFHTENQILDSAKAATKLAASLVIVFAQENNAATLQDSWRAVIGSYPRAWWANKTHFVAISRMDGKPRGSASGKLWTFKPLESDFMDTAGHVMQWPDKDIPPQ